MTAALRDAVRARAREFEILPLLRVLARLGYGPDRVVFAAHATPVSPASLVHAVEFRDEPERQARVVLNLGLSGAQGLLPSYLLQKVDAGDVDAQAFHGFLGFLEHAVLSRFVSACHPEASGRVFGDWEETKRRYLQLVDLRAPAGLHTLFTAAFPELGVSVEKRAADRTVATRALRLGRAALGEAAFGDRARLPAARRCVVLLAEEERTAAGAPWVQEIRTRLDRLVFPSLAPLGADLQVDLVLTAERTWARLDRQSALGFDRAFGAAGSRRRLRIFSGRVTGPHADQPSARAAKAR